MLWLQKLGWAGDARNITTKDINLKLLLPEPEETMNFFLSVDCDLQTQIHLHFSEIAKSRPERAIKIGLNFKTVRLEIDSPV